MKSRWMLGAAVIGILVIVAILAAVLLSGGDGEDDLEGSVANQYFPAPTVPGQLNPDTTQVNTLGFAEVKEILGSSQSDQYVVVKVNYQGNSSTIAGTDTTVRYYDTAGLLAALPDEAAQIILYSSDKTASLNTALYLLAQGYTAVWHYPGGISDWTANGGATQ